MVRKEVEITNTTIEPRWYCDVCGKEIFPNKTLGTCYFCGKHICPECSIEEQYIPMCRLNDYYIRVDWCHSCDAILKKYQPLIDDTNYKVLDLRNQIVILKSSALETINTALEESYANNQ